MKKEVKEDLQKLRSTLGFALLCAVNRTINRRITGKRLEWNRIHERKLAKLFAEVPNTQEEKVRPRNIVHNFSSYDLTAEEYHILSFGLDHHVPARLNENEIKTEFETFFYGLNKQLKHLTSDERDELKTKLRRSCENYYKVKTNTKVQDTIDKLAKEKNIRILKQDKGRGVVILDNTKYIEKCMSLLNTNQFEKRLTDNTKEVEEQVQKALFGIKKAIGEEEYKKIYPSGSNPGRFYGTAKIHKVKANDPDKLGKLPIRPIVSNIGTATHKTARFLCKLLAPLGKSKYTVESTRDFIGRIKNIKVPHGCKMISFDVVSLFTNVPLQKTIDIILRKVYTEKLIKTKIPRNKMKELLLLCTQGVPFTFNGETYMQIDGVMMGSPLGALFANIFMCELENTVIPKLGETIRNWTRYVDDTFAFIETQHLENVKRELDAFHPNIKFTHELEDEGSIPFLDVRITKTNDHQIETSVYRKETNTDIYMNWYSHAPTIWKIATLKSLIRRAFLISSKPDTLNAELVHLKDTFCDKNDYPRKLVEKIIENERLSHQTNIQDEEDSPTDEEEDKPVTLSLNLPYAGDKGEKLVLKMQKYISKAVNKSKNLVSVNTIYKARRLGASFNIKDKIR